MNIHTYFRPWFNTTLHLIANGTVSMVLLAVLLWIYTTFGLASTVVYVLGRMLLNRHLKLWLTSFIRRHRACVNDCPCLECKGELTARRGPMSAYCLTNVEASAAEHPDTFEIAPRWMRESLGRGWFAKLIFTEPDGAERMWVRVTSAHADGSYRGELRNQPLGINLALGAPIMFGPEHVADLEQPEDAKELEETTE